MTKIRISELKPNPFKKEINKGKLDESRLEILKESIEHNTLPEIFTVRKKGDAYELTSGHHRIEALKRYKGKDHEVMINVVDFDDEQMLIDMVRENITQRNIEFKDTEDSVMLAKKYLTERLRKGTLHRAEHTRQDQDIGAREIAKFLSKNGKTISHSQIAKYINISEGLNPKVHSIVTKGNQGHTDSGKIGLELANKLAMVADKSDQNGLLKALKEANKEGISQEKLVQELTKFKAAPEEIKKDIVSGNIKISEMDDAIFEKKVSENNEKNKDSQVVFYPNFQSRVLDFKQEVSKLEYQVLDFKKIFGSPRFKSGYPKLGKKEKLFVDDTIVKIKARIKKCYDTVSDFEKTMKMVESTKQIETK